MCKLLTSFLLFFCLESAFATELRTFYYSHEGSKRLLYANQVKNPQALLLVLHDYRSTAVASANTMLWQEYVPDSWMVIYPEMNVSLAAASLDVDSVINEYYFLQAITDGLKNKYPGIRDVFLAGEGTGAAMALEYAYFNSEVTAIAGYSLRGYIARAEKPRDTSLILAHGARDKSNPIMGGRVKINNRSIDVLPAITPAVQWAKNLSCSNQPIQKRMDKAIRGTYFKECNNNKKVIFASLEYTANHWPNDEVRLTQRFVSFFESIR